MRIARAEDTDRDLQAVLGLIEEAKTWLGTIGTDQWASPWPDLKSRDARVRRGLAVGKTWIVWDDEIAVATVTIATGPNTKVWSKHAAYDLSERAVYAHRLITARKYAGYGLGAELIDWAGLGGRRDYGAKWIRIDVWTSNEGLHEYYLKRGFERCGTCADARLSVGCALSEAGVGDPASRHSAVRGTLGRIRPTRPAGLRYRSRHRPCQSRHRRGARRQRSRPYAGRPRVLIETRSARPGAPRRASQ